MEQCRLVHGRGARFDQVEYSLSLQQVYLAVQEGLTGKLAWFREPGSGCAHRLQHQLRRQGPAVTADFQHVFAGVGGRATEPDHDHVVHRLVRVGVPEGSVSSDTRGLLRKSQPGRDEN